MIYSLAQVASSPETRAFIEKRLEGVNAFAFISPLPTRTNLEAAQKHASRDEVLGMLARSVIAAIGEPTRKAFGASCVRVYAVPESVTFERLLDATEECVEERPVCDRSTDGFLPRA